MKIVLKVDGGIGKSVMATAVCAAIKKQHPGFSSVLGGSGNNDNGFTYVGLYGQNVNGVMNNAMHVEEIVIQNLPVDPVPGGGFVFAGLPNGALYTTAAPGGPFLSRIVYIK